MKKLTISGIIFIMCFLGALLNADKKKVYGHKTIDALVYNIKKAAQEKNLELYLQCVCWEKLPEKLRTRFKKSKPLFFKRKLLDIKIEVVKKNPLKNSKHYKFNVNFKGNLVLRYKGIKFTIKAPYGIYNKKYYLATLVKK